MTKQNDKMDTNDDFQVKIKKYKILADERHIIINRYAQAMLLFLIAMSFAFKELIQSKQISNAILGAVLITIVNLVWIWALTEVKNWAMKTEEKMKNLELDLLPYSTKWGYTFAILVAVFSEIGTLLILGFKVL